MEWFTYGQVLEMASRFAEELAARGIGKGERVMLWGENCAEWVAAFFGCAMRGVVVVPMDDGAAADFAGELRGRWRLGFGFVRGSMRRENNAGALPLRTLRKSKAPPCRKERDKDGAPLPAGRGATSVARTSCRLCLLLGLLLSLRAW
jgi:hypothetical protein